MYLLEIALIVVLLAQLVAENVVRMSRKVRLIFSATALFAVVLSFVLGQFRWQMATAYLLFGILSLLLLRKGRSHIALRSAGVLLGVLLLVIAATLSSAMPIVKLPVPDGPYAVGFGSFPLVDESRSETYFGFPGERRELSVHVWYPGVIDGSQALPAVRTLWEDLYSGPADPVTFVTGYMRGIKTHSYPDIPLSLAGGTYPIIVFSHALALNAEQNTPLMEHLASHGYIVIGVNHTRMSARVIVRDGRVIPVDPEKLRDAFSEGASIDRVDFTRRYEGASSDEERAALQMQLGERFSRMNEQVAIRVDDLRFVMDVIADPSKADAAFALLLARGDVKRVGLLGMSVGGATVIDACKVDSRCRAGLNLDGGLFGQHQREPLQSPFLSVISRGNEQLNGYLQLASKSDYYEVLVDGASHGDFLDLTFLMPFMKWLGANGSIAPNRVVDIVNAVSLRFFDAYLRDGSKPQFDTREFPELVVRAKVQ